MKEINVRKLFRKFKSLFPIPSDGIRVMRREGDFYIYKEKKTADMDQKEVDIIVDKVYKILSKSIILPAVVASIPTICEWNRIMSGAQCSNSTPTRIKIASLGEGEIIPTDWQEISLCSHHIEVIKQSKSFSIQE